MSKIDDLKAFATPKPIQGAESEIALAIDSDSAIDDAVHALDGYFQENPARQAVLLRIEGKTAGYLNREDFCSSAPGVKGNIGFGQGAQLPGTGKCIAFEYHCPKSGCTEPSILVIDYDENNPPRCSIHSDEILQRVDL